MRKPKTVVRRRHINGSALAADPLSNSTTLSPRKPSESNWERDGSEPNPSLLSLTRLPAAKANCCQGEIQFKLIDLSAPHAKVLNEAVPNEYQRRGDATSLTYFPVIGLGLLLVRSLDSTRCDVNKLEADRTHDIETTERVDRIGDGPVRDPHDAQSCFWSVHLLRSTLLSQRWVRVGVVNEKSTRVSLK